MPDALLTCITAVPDETSSRSSVPPAQVQNATIYDDEEKTAIPGRPNFMFRTSAMLKKFMPRKDFGRDGRFGPNRLVSHILSDLRIVVFNSYANLLFVFVPAGFALNYAKQNPIAIFAVNMVAVTGPSLLIQLATRQVEQRSSELVGSMVNASFSNIVHFITSILLLKSHQIAVLRTSLIGGILSNMHLMLGLGFLIGGLRYKEEKYNSTTSQIQGTLMLLAMTSLVIPTASRLLANTTASGILSQSRVTSVILLAVYISFCFFQFNTHNMLFMYELGEQEEEEAEEEAAVTPKLHSVTICLLLLTGMTLIGFHAQFVTDSLNGLMASAGLNRSNLIGG